MQSHDFSIKNTVGLLLILVLFLSVLAPTKVGALALQNRIIKVAVPIASANTTHEFNFDYPSASNIGSVVFEYCDNPLPAVACVEPSGVDVSGAVLDSQTGEVGYSILSTSTNTIVLSRLPSVATPQPATYEFSTMINPDASNNTFFVRLSIHASVDGTGPSVDEGAVATTVNNGLAIVTEVPPYLRFCVAVTVSIDCLTTGSSSIDFGILASNKTSIGSSQMSAETNADFGYAIVVTGTTMTSGNKVIPALTAGGGASLGTSRFGMNLRDNSSPNVGIEPTGTGDGVIGAGYNTINSFRFNSGETVATAPNPTYANKYTTSYIVNVSSTQQPGIYTTTLTYICTSTF